jgi:hypothetical protein
MQTLAEISEVPCPSDSNAEPQTLSLEQLEEAQGGIFMFIAGFAAGVALGVAIGKALS